MHFIHVFPVYNKGWNKYSSSYQQTQRLACSCKIAVHETHSASLCSQKLYLMCVRKTLPHLSNLLPHPDQNCPDKVLANQTNPSTKRCGFKNGCLAFHLFKQIRILQHFTFKKWLLHILKDLYHFICKILYFWNSCLRQQKSKKKNQ